jgi:myosin protein heavy chain
MLLISSWVLLNQQLQLLVKKVKQAMPVKKAFASRDALTKAIYGRLFLFLIKKINETIGRSKRSSFIGVLDIAGFEIFEYNTFEQLCINYTNEKLQQFFNNHMFKLEQEEYIREQINWTFIDFGMDSQATIDLIDAKQPPGIMTLLDESVYVNADDKRFLEKCHSQHKIHPKYNEPRFSKTAMEISHYAGKVSYETENWVEKNKDPLQVDLMTAMVESTNELVKRIFTDRGLAVAGQSGSLVSGKAKAGRAARGANFITVGAHHKEGLNSLMKTLYSTEPHFIRCILPNHAKKAGQIEDACVLEQLRCNGVLEGIRISRKGFPNRIVYSEFIKRYYLLCPSVPRNPADVKEATKAVLEFIKPKDYSDGPAMKPETPYRFGLTKIFFRTGTLAWIEEQREAKVGELIIDVQNACRAFADRKRWRLLRIKTIASKTIQQTLRAWISLKNDPWWKLYTKWKPTRKIFQTDQLIQELKEKIKDLEAQLTAKTHEAEELTRQLEQANSRNEDLESRLKEKEDEIEDLNDTISDLERDKSGLNQKIQDLQEDLADEQTRGNGLLAQKNSLQEKLTATEDSLKAEQDAKSHLEGEKKNLESQLDSAQSKHKSDADQIARLEDKERKLNEEIEEIASANKDTSKALEVARKKAQG